MWSAEGDTGPVYTARYLPQIFGGINVADGKYTLIVIGTLIMKDTGMVLRCELCGTLHDGESQQQQINKLFKCLSTHVPEEHIFEIYEQRGTKIVSSINREVWEKARRATKYKKS
jgi:hypothetical protein